MAASFREYRQQALKWYKSARWQRIRKEQLTKEPYCQCPHHIGQHIKANIVDHIKPHRGDTRLFWDKSNLQSLTKPCHDIFKQSEEKGGAGFDKGCNPDGTPLNRESSWYQ